MRAVERFMKHYFLVAKDVGDLTRIVCSALEMKQLKSAPRLDALLNKLPWSNRSKAIEFEDFQIENGRITLADQSVFQKDSINLMRLFYLAEKHEVKFHPDALRAVRASLRLIGPEFRRHPEVNRLFLELLTESENPENVLRKMNEAGVLGRFVPAFGKIVSMMQFNMYHHYTVDEHLIQAIGVLAEIRRGETQAEHQLATELFQDIRHRRALFVAMFLHDIAKGRDEDHSIAGARVARLLCPRLGMSVSETDTVSWLVEHHLVMSQIAQSRDIYDPKTIQDFAKIVQSLERLKLLLILTVADIRAVGPGVWNGWKGQLLRSLYFETEPVLAGGHTRLSHKDRVASSQEALRAELSDWPSADVQRFIERHYPAYWLRTDTTRQIAHARLIARAEDEGALVTDIVVDGFTDVTEFTVFCPNHPSLLCMIAGACAATGANIVDAQISTTRDGMALDTIFLQKEFDWPEDERRRAQRISVKIGSLLKSKIRVENLMSSKRAPKGSVRAFSVEPEVLIDNTLSDDLTVIEVTGLDRPGLLYDLTRTMSELRMDITSAHIATFGEKVVDVFYVTDVTGSKITGDNRKSKILSHLEAVLEPGKSGKRGGPAKKIQAVGS
ncbi:MAG: [protein-PII] uridylyltransferase [Methyloligellaceae bacterium]